MPRSAGILPAILLAFAWPALAWAAADSGTVPASPARQGFERMISKSQEHVAKANQDPGNRGAGPYPARQEVDLALPDFSIYRPADLAPFARRKLGLVIWGNGGCSNDGASARAHLAEIASHGYLVIAPGRPLTGPLALPGAPAPAFMRTTVQDLWIALDWALAENGRRGSPYFQRLDSRMIAAAGHSCGAMQAMILADDPRIATLLIHNSAVMPVLPDNPPLVMHDERLKGLQRPTLMLLGGESDIVWRFAVSTFENITKAPVFFASRETGHDGTFAKPNGGENAQIAVAWLEWQLRGDRNASLNFLGRDCLVCSNPAWTVRKKRLQ